MVIIDDQQAQVTPWVRADNVTGAYEVVRHLTQLGHRRIAHIQGPAEYLASHDRHQGYLRALARQASRPIPSSSSRETFCRNLATMALNASSICRQRRGLQPSSPSADQMAYGVLRAAEERNIAIPKEIALVGFDDDAPSAHVLPPLTTVRQPSFEMGQEAIKLLLDLVAQAEGQELRA